MDNTHAKNSSTLMVRDTYPHIDQIRDEWNLIHERIRDGLLNLSPDSLNKTPLVPFDSVSESVGHYGHLSLIIRQPISGRSGFYDERLGKSR